MSASSSSLRVLVAALGLAFGLACCSADLRDLSEGCSQFGSQGVTCAEQLHSNYETSSTTFQAICTNGNYSEDCIACVVSTSCANIATACAVVCNSTDPFVGTSGGIGGSSGSTHATTTSTSTGTTGTSNTHTSTSTSSSTSSSSSGGFTICQQCFSSSQCNSGFCNFSQGANGFCDYNGNCLANQSSCSPVGCGSKTGETCHCF
jgi:hypothetical protein